MIECIFVRGIPGSGKSTFARTIAPKLDALVINQDDFFVDQSGYKYDPALITEAAKWFNAKFMYNVGIRTIILDKCFPRVSDMYPYMYRRDHLDVPYTVYTCSGHYGSIHSVPDDEMKRFISSFEW